MNFSRIFSFNLPLTGCNQLNGGLRYTKILMSGTEVCLLYHVCQSVPPLLPDAQCGQGSLAIEIERTKRTAMNIMDVRKERAKQTNDSGQSRDKKETNVFFLIPWSSWPLAGRSCCSMPVRRPMRKVRLVHVAEVL